MRDAGVPIGMVQYHELVDQLVTLAMAGENLRTLYLFARFHGLHKVFEQELRRAKGHQQELSLLLGVQR